MLTGSHKITHQPLMEIAQCKKESTTQEMLPSCLIAAPNGHHDTLKSEGFFFSSLHTSHFSGEVLAWQTELRFGVKNIQWLPKVDKLMLLNDLWSKIASKIRSRIGSNHLWK
jgi:hypothetical protein